MIRAVGLAFLAASVALARQLPLRAYSDSDGLPGNQLVRIIRDSRQFLWFCTRDGLSRFDGHRFVNYGTSDGLPNNLIYDVAETPDGKRWVATNRGLAEFRPLAQPHFVLRSIAGEQDRSIRRLLVDRQGRLWAGTSKGLFMAHGMGDFSPVELKTPVEFIGSRITALMEDRQGAVWIGIRSGLYRRAPDGAVDRYTTRDGLPADSVEALLEDRAGELWVGTRGGICRIRKTLAGGTGRFRVERVRFPEVPVWDVIETRDGRIWCGTERGLAEIHRNAGSRGTSFTLFGGAERLRISAVYTLAQDPEGNIWLGTESGAAKLSRSGFYTYSEADGLAASNVVAIFESGRDGQLVVATRRERPNAPRETLMLHSFDGVRFTSARPNLPVPGAPGWTAGQIALQDRTGEWWLATSSGLLRFPPANAVQQLAFLVPEAIRKRTHALLGDDVTVVYGDARGDIWFQSTGAAALGLHRWSRNNGLLQTYSPQDVGVPADADVGAFAEDHSGNLWIGWGPASLTRYREGKFTSFGAKASLPKGTILSLHVDATGRLWAGSMDSGLLRIDDTSADSMKVIVYGPAQGLAASYVPCITEDRWGRIYACTTRGVERLDPASGAIHHFTRADGLPSGLLKVAYTDRKGTLWFGAEDGLASLDPVPPEASRPPPVLLSVVRIRGAPHALSELGEQTISLPELESSQGQLQFEFFSPNFKSGENVRFQYRLAGANSDWSSPAGTSTVNYAALAPGRYRFEARAILADGTVSTTPAQVTFRVLPPLWHRWWFLAAAGLTLSALVWSAHRYRVRQILALERVRARIARDLHDDIGSSLSQIAVLGEVALSRLNESPPEIRTPIADAAQITRELTESLSDVVWAMNPRHDSLDDLVHRVRRFASELLGARGIPLSFSEPVIQPGVPLNAEARRELFLIAKEAINNVARHSGATQAEVRFQLPYGYIELLIADNGGGFDASQSFDGNGLPNIRRRAAALHGDLSIASVPGRTELRVRVPLAHKGPGLPAKTRGAESKAGVYSGFFATFSNRWRKRGCHPDRG